MSERSDEDGPVGAPANIDPHGLAERFGLTENEYRHLFDAVDQRVKDATGGWTGYARDTSSHGAKQAFKRDTAVWAAMEATLTWLNDEGRLLGANVR